jgi:hypothetical protein
VVKNWISRRRVVNFLFFSFFKKSGKHEKRKKKDKERKRKKFSIPLFINMKNIFSIFFFVSYVLHSFCQQKKATNTSLVRVRGLSLIG